MADELHRLVLEYLEAEGVSQGLVNQVRFQLAEPKAKLPDQPVKDCKLRRIHRFVAEGCLDVSVSSLGSTGTKWYEICPQLTLQGLHQAIRNHTGVSIFRQQLVPSETIGALPLKNETLSLSALQLPLRLSLIVPQYIHELTDDLLEAVGTGELAQVERLLYSLADPNQIDSTNTGTALHMASLKGRLDVVSLLCEAAAADINQELRAGVTPFLLASQQGRLDVVRYFCAAGSDLNKATAGGVTPLGIASTKGHLEVVRTICDSYPDADKETALALAAQEGNVAVVRFLCKAGADLNAQVARAKGATPVFFAALKGHLEVVRYLCQVGANHQKPDETNRTPLSIAIQNGHQDVAQFLRDGPRPFNSPSRSASRSAKRRRVR